MQELLVEVLDCAKRSSHIPVQSNRGVATIRRAGPSACMYQNCPDIPVTGHEAGEASYQSIACVLRHCPLLLAFIERERGGEEEMDEEYWDEVCLVVTSC